MSIITMATGSRTQAIVISILLFSFTGYVTAFYVRPQVVTFTTHPSDTVTCEGCKVELTCQFPWQQTIGEIPDPQLEWEVNGTKIFTDSDLQMSSTLGHMRLTISSARLSHAGVYRCVVRDGNDSSGCQVTPCIPTVTISQEATVQVISYSDAVVTVNLTRCSTTILPCGSEIIASSSRPDIRWFRHSVEVDSIAMEDSLVLSSGDLLLHWSGGDGGSGEGSGSSEGSGSGDGGVGGRYECVVTFPGTNITMATFEVKLVNESIQMEVGPQIELFATYQTVTEGSTVDLVCSFRDYCASDVTWWTYEDFAGGTQTVPNGTLIGGHVLRLGPLLVGDSTQYCCHNNNTSGAALRSCMELEVLSSAKPVITSSQHNTTLFISTVDRETRNIEINCSIAETGLPPTTTWFHNGKKFNTSVTKLTVSTLGRNDSLEPYGVYQCFVSNAAGESILVTRVLPPDLTNPPGKAAYAELPRPVEGINVWMQVSWMPPDYTANLSSLHYRVYYTRNTMNASTTTSEILAAGYASLRAAVGAISPFTDQVVSERGRYSISEWINPNSNQCNGKVLYPPNVSLYCEGGVLAVNWTNSPRNAGRESVNNYQIAGYCSYNGTLTLHNETYYSSWPNEIRAQDVPAGTECSFQGAARPYQSSTLNDEDVYCYRLDLIAWNPSNPHQCYITAVVSLEREQYEVRENQSAVEVCITAEGFGVTVNVSTFGMTAQAGEDFVESSQQIAVSSSSNRMCVSIAIVNSRAVEETESFMVVLHSLDPYVMINPVASNATISIVDSSNVTIGFEQQGYSVNEDAGTVSVCAVVLEGELERQVEMIVATQSDNTTDGEDFTQLVQMLTFNSTSRRLCVEVEILEDDIVESNETFILSLTTSDPAVLHGGFTTATITDNDDVAIGFEQGGYTVREDARTVSVCAVVLEGELERQVEMIVATQSDNATAGEDFTHLVQMLTFNSTSRRLCVEVEILEDDIVESNETFILSLTTNDPAVLHQGFTTVAIIDNDDVAIGFEQGGYTVREDARTVSVCAVVLEGELERQVEMIVATQSGNATAGEDFTHLVQVLTFNSTSRRLCVEVDILEDDVFENNETFILSLTTDDRAVLLGGFTTATITDNDDITIGFEQGGYTVREDAGTVSVCAVVLEGELERQVEMIVATQSGNATAGEDFTHLVQVLTFDSTSRRLCVEVDILEDDVFENNETFILSLTTDDRAVLLGGFTTATITDNDDVTIGFEQGGYSVNEAAGTVSVCAVVLEGELERQVEMTLATHSDNATAGEDFSERVQMLAFNDTLRKLCVEVDILEDDVFENNETFILSLTTSDPAVLHGGFTTVTITDNDDITIGFEQGGYTVREDAGTVSVCAVVLEGELERQVEMIVATQSDNATAGEDFTHLVQVLTFDSTSRRLCVEVDILEDDVFENNETFILSLTTNDPAVLHGGFTTVAIIDNDVVTIGFEQGGYSVNEAAGTVSVCAVVLEGELERQVEMTLATHSDNATAGEDFSEHVQMLAFNATLQKLCVEVDILEDDVFENNETFILSLTTSDPAVLLGGFTTVTITDNDDVTIGFEQGGYTVREDAGTVSVCAVVLEGELERQVEMIVATQSGNATDGEDFTQLVQILTFNSTSRRLCVEVDILEDDVFESNETFILSLTTSDPAVLHGEFTTVTVTINDGAGTSSDTLSVATSVTSVAVVAILSMAVVALAVCFWQQRKRDKETFIVSPFLNPEGQAIDPSYEPVTIQVRLYEDEDAISMITTYNKLCPDQNPKSETESVHVTETLRRSSESGSLVPLTLPLHPNQNLTEQVRERHIHDISQNSTCSSQPYIHFIDSSGNPFSGVPLHRKAFRISSSSYDSGHPVCGVETITEEDAPNHNPADSTTAVGDKQDETDEAVGPPQPETVREEDITTTQEMTADDGPQSGAETNIAILSKTDTQVSITDSARRSETPSAVRESELQQAGPSIPHHITSLNPASTNPLTVADPEYGPLNMPLTADPELARFMPSSDSGFGGDSSNVYFV